MYGSAASENTLPLEEPARSAAAPDEHVVLTLHAMPVVLPSVIVLGCDVSTDIEMRSPEASMRLAGILQLLGLVLRCDVGTMQISCSVVDWSS